MKWLMCVGLFLLLLVLLSCLACLATRFCHRLKSRSTAPSGEPPSSPTLLQPPNSMYVPAPDRHQDMGPGGCLWVPEPNSSWQPSANQQQQGAGAGQNQGWTQRGFPTAPSTMPQFSDLPPTYDEAIVAKSQALG